MERMVRVNELLKREVCEVLERLICPNVNGLITVTKVKTAPNLRNATVMISIYGCSDEERKANFNLVLKHRKDIQQEVMSRVSLKYSPKLRIDHGFLQINW